MFYPLSLTKIINFDLFMFHFSNVFDKISFRYSAVCHSFNGFISRVEFIKSNSSFKKWTVIAKKFCIVCDVQISAEQLK